jgi:hypothetical protein
MNYVLPKIKAHRLEDRVPDLEGVYVVLCTNQNIAKGR